MGTIKGEVEVDFELSVALEEGVVLLLLVVLLFDCEVGLQELESELGGEFLGEVCANCGCFGSISG